MAQFESKLEWSPGVQLVQDAIVFTAMEGEEVVISVHNSLPPYNEVGRAHASKGNF